ncbi:MAG: DivIVA domain-containing protein [Acidimicrobiia bacterium]|nr:DivIVA domain-containing protein [Acidimicrobiia bacterium]
MADGDRHRRSIPGAARLSPDEIVSRGFPSAFRGISEAEVRSFLRRVADDVAHSRERERELTDRVEELERQLSDPPAITERQLLDALGEETARVLRSAQEAAQDIRTKAEERATLIVREAQDDARRMREEAETLLADRLREANEASTALQRAAETRAAELRAETERTVEEQRERSARDAEAEIEAARASGREMVSEARAVRERVLADLARRRSLLQAQIEELRGGRDRLLEAYRLVKRTLAEATEALSHADRRPEAAGPVALPALEDELERSVASMEERPGVAPGAEPEVPPAGPAEAPREVEIVVEHGRPEEGGAGGTESGTGPVEVEGATPAEEGGAGGTESGTGPVEVEGATPAEEGGPTGLRAYVRSALGLGEGTAGEGVAAEELPPDQERPAEPDSGEPRKDVQEIFARLRASREEAVAGAREVLASEVEEGAEADTATPEHGDDEARGEDDAAALATRAEILRPVERALLRRAKRMLQDEQNALLDALRTLRGRPTADRILPPLDLQLAAWSEVLGPAVAEAYRGARPDAAEPPEDLARALTEGFVTPMRERVGSALDESGEPTGDRGEGEPADADSAERIGARYREWRSESLEPAVGDLLAVAFARGVFDAAPEGSVLRWVPSEVGRCPDCDDNALEPTMKGEAFPTGQTHPPAHPGCRCLLAAAAAVGAGVSATRP